MIDRYEVKDISCLWSEQYRFEMFYQVELALLRVLEKRGIIPQGVSEKFKGLQINPQRIKEIEKVTRHDVIAFCTSITEQLNPEVARFFHYGVTSSDILDTALSLQMRASIEIICKDLRHLIKSLEEKIKLTEDLLCIGRSHGMYAEPMIFAQKFLSFHQEFSRRLRDYEDLLATEITGQISGAVGNYTVLDSEIEGLVLEELNLKVEPVSTQVIARDHIGKIISTGALLASGLERLAVEIRLLHHSDVSEVHEGFKAGQKGSSTMPHKKNPISAENISGLTRIIKGHVEVALQNNVLWHERDISHSSAERLYLPDHFGLISYTLRRMSSTISELELHRERIEAKALENFSAISSYLLHEMILLNPHSREELYTLVQEASFTNHNLDDFFSWLNQRAHELGYTMPKKISPSELKAHYQKRFRELLFRVGLKG
jgi:adenylosuccinate lyase